jgi:hypothetical protein
MATIDYESRMTKSLHIPWYEWARAKLSASSNTSVSAQSVLQSALAFADAGFEQKAALRAPRDGSNHLLGQRSRHAKEVHAAQVARDMAIKVALAHGVQQSFVAKAGQQTANDAMRALCERQSVPPGLALAQPDEHLRQAGNWVDKVSATLQSWERNLSVSFLKSEADWPFAWNTGIALTAFDRLLAHAGGTVAKIEQFLLNSPDMPLPRFCASERGAATCIPTSIPELKAKPGLKVRLDSAPWLAELLQFGKATPLNAALWSLDFDTKRIGSKGNEQHSVNTGLKVGHLYYAVLIERLYQLQPGLCTLQGTSMMQLSPTDLPTALAQELSPPERPAATLALRAMNASAAKNPAPEIRLKTRRSVNVSALPLDISKDTPSALPARQTDSTQSAEDGAFNLLIPSNLLQYQAPIPSYKYESFGSVVLSADELDATGDMQWMDTVLLVHRKDAWFVVRPELVEDEDHADRVHLTLYSELPEALLAVTDKQSIVKAMSRAHWAIHIQDRGGFVCAVVDMPA